MHLYLYIYLSVFVHIAQICLNRACTVIVHIAQISLNRACTVIYFLFHFSYLSVCIHMFVYLMVEYFGGDEKMIAALADDKIRMNTPPCCCCCVCLPRITLTK